LIRRAVVLLSAATLAAVAAEPPDVYHVEDPALFGRPKRIVEPVYPKDALAQRVTGYVDLRGHVSPLHEFADPEFTPGAPEAAAFVQPLKDVLKLWEFYPVPRNDCFPSDTMVKLRVVFDIQDDKPRFSVLVEPAASPGRKIEVLYRRNPTYPRGPMRSGRQAYVYSRSIVAPDGTVSRVETEVYPPQDPIDSQAFAHAVEGSLGKWRYVSSPPAETRERIVCEDVIFLLRD